MIVWPKKFLLKFHPMFYLQGDQLQIIGKFKYLGYIFRNDLKDDDDVQYKVRRLYALGNMLIRKFSKGNEQCKTLMFKTYFSNLYCDSLWNDFKVSSIATLRTAHNNIFRKLFNIRRFIMEDNHYRIISVSQEFVTHGIDNLDVMLRKSACSLEQRLSSSRNRLVRALCDSEAAVYSALRQRWRQLVYRPALLQ